MTLANLSKEKRFAEGAFLFQEGDKGSEMYVVLEGKAMISKFIPGPARRPWRSSNGATSSARCRSFDGEPRSADAQGPLWGRLTVLALDQSTVKEVLAMDPHASLEFPPAALPLVATPARDRREVVGWRILSGERTESSASA